MASNEDFKRNDRRSSRRMSYQRRNTFIYMQDVVVLYVVGDDMNVNLKRADTWKIDDARRHWVLHEHCEYWMFPCQNPVLALSSEMGRYFWHLHCASGIPTPRYKKDITRCAALTVAHLNNCKRQTRHLIFCDIMFNVNWLDYRRRLSILEEIGKFIGLQNLLTVVSLENALLEYVECIQLMTIIGNVCGETLKRLYLWKVFTFNHMLRRGHYQHKVGGSNNMGRYIDYLKALSMYENLRVLAVNFTYLIGNDGETLLSLGSIIEGSFRELQLLCLEEDLSIITSLYEKGEEKILPDSTWRKAREMCPYMRVYIVIFCIPKHELSLKFLSPSMPLCSFHLSSGIDTQQLCWHIDITMRILMSWYSLQLEYLYLHLWQNRDILDEILINDCLNSFPHLKTLEFIGILHNKNTLERICKKIKDSDDLALRKLRILVQGKPSKDISDLKKDVERIQKEYQDVFSEKSVQLQIGMYHC